VELRGIEADAQSSETEIPVESREVHGIGPLCGHQELTHPEGGAAFVATRN
jgi:hypothetical protein